MVPSVKKASLKIKFVNKPLLILAYIVQFVDWIRRINALSNCCGGLPGINHSVVLGQFFGR